MKPIALQLADLYKTLSDVELDFTSSMIRTIINVQKQALEGKVNKHSLTEALGFLMSKAEDWGQVRSWSLISGKDKIETYFTSLDGSVLYFDLPFQAQAKALATVEEILEGTPLIEDIILEALEQWNPEGFDFDQCLELIDALETFELVTNDLGQLTDVGPYTYHPIEDIIC